MISKPIPYGRQCITDGDIQAVIETLKSDYLTQGPKIKEFEAAFAEYVGAKYAVAVIMLLLVSIYRLLHWMSVPVIK